MLDHLKAHFTVLDFIEIGYSYNVRFANMARVARVHIRATVDDCQIIYAYYGKRKQWWHYGVESLYMFQLLHDDSRFSAKQKTPSKYFK